MSEDYALGDIAALLDELDETAAERDEARKQVIEQGEYISQLVAELDILKRKHRNLEVAFIHEVAHNCTEAIRDVPRNER